MHAFGLSAAARSMTAMRRLILVIFTIVAVTAPAVAGNLILDVLGGHVGTTSTKSSPIFANGKLEGCTIEYYAFIQDRSYSKSKIILIGGNFGLTMIGDRLAAILEVVVQDFDEATGAKTPNAPTRAYLISSTLETSLSSVVGSYRSDTLGAIFVLSQPEPSLDIIGAALATKQITLAFNKGSSATDIRVDLDLTVLDMRPDGTRVTGSRTVDEFGSCLGQLSGRGT